MDKPRLFTTVRLIVIIAIVCICVRRKSIILFCNKGISCVAYPVLSFACSVKAVMQEWHTKAITREEQAMALHALRDERDALLSELIQLKGVYHYDSSVRELKEFCRRYVAQRLVYARVIGRRLTSNEHCFLINKGSAAGVAAGMIVVATNALVGRVLEVFPWYSRVLLITDMRSKIPVVCAETGTHAIFEGAHQVGRGTLGFVSHLSHVVQNELVMTSGRGSVYPEGFAVGRITEYILDASALYYSVAVSTLFDPERIELCAVFDKEDL